MKYVHEDGEPQCVNCNIDLKHHSDTQLKLCYEWHQIIQKLANQQNVTSAIRRELLIRNLTKK